MRINLSKLKEAGKDLFYLLNKGYSKRSCLELVGNRYNLDSNERHILQRAIYDRKEIKKRREKILSVRKIKGKKLGIDGYNVLITLESAIKKKPVILCKDGLIRDISGVSKKYRISKSTLKSLNLILEVLVNYKPKKIFFYFDSPISKSGELAYLVREKIKEFKLSGDAFAVKIPEKYLLKLPLVSTSDFAIVDRVNSVFDLAGFIIRKRFKKIISLK